MTRLGFDPWREAARLSDLPRETAARAFAVTVAMLPEEDWKESEANAARLVNRLPGRSALARVEAAPIEGEKMKSGFARWLVWVVLAIALLFIGLYLFGDNNPKFGQGAGLSAQQ